MRFWRILRFWKEWGIEKKSYALILLTAVLVVGLAVLAVQQIGQREKHVLEQDQRADAAVKAVADAVAAEMEQHRLCNQAFFQRIEHLVLGQPDVVVPDECFSKFRAATNGQNMIPTPTPEASPSRPRTTTSRSSPTPPPKEEKGNRPPDRTDPPPQPSPTPCSTVPVTGLCRPV